MATNTIDNQIAKTLAYLASEEGQDAKAFNLHNGHDLHYCIMAAAQTAAHCRKPEVIQAIERGVIVAWVRGNGRVA